jgi:hypothetical protein
VLGQLRENPLLTFPSPQAQELILLLKLLTPHHGACNFYSALGNHQEKGFAKVLKLLALARIQHLIVRILHNSQ